MKKWISLTLIALLLCASTAALAETLIMGTECTFAPLEYIDDNGQPAGFDVELGQLIADKLGYEFFVEDMAFDGLLMALDSGKIDMVIAGMTVRPDRLEQADFSESYFSAQQQVIVRKGYEGIQSFDDLADKIVAVQDGTTGYFLVSEDLGLPANQISAFKSSADAILELKSGRADCVIIDTAPANVFVATNDDLMLLEGIDTSTEYYGIAVKKGNEELLAVINEVLAEIKENGVYDELIAKYFAGDITY